MMAAAGIAEFVEARISALEVSASANQTVRERTAGQTVAAGRVALVLGGLLVWTVIALLPVETDCAAKMRTSAFVLKTVESAPAAAIGSAAKKAKATTLAGRTVPSALPAPANARCAWQDNVPFPALQNRCGATRRLGSLGRIPLPKRT